MTRAVVLLSTTLCLGAACSVAVAGEWAKNFVVGSAPVLDIRCTDANVIVNAGSGGQIAANVLTKGWEIRPGEVEVIERQMGDHVSIDVRLPKNRHWGNWGKGQRSIRLEVTAPANTRIQAHTGDGNVTVAGMKSEVRVATGDGNVVGSDLDGRLEARTGDGNIRASGRFEALEIETGDGNVDVDALAGSTATGVWRVKTGDGNVRLKLPETLKADVDATTGDGRVSSELPLTIGSGKVDSHQVRGKLNGGGPSLTVRTGDGNIHLASAR